MKIRIPQGILVQCPDCDQTCNGGKGLSTHMRYAHKMKGVLSNEKVAEILNRSKNKPAKKRKYTKRITPAQTQKPEQVEAEQFHFHYCPQCGAPVSEMATLISIGQKIRG